MNKTLKIVACVLAVAYMAYYKPSAGPNKFYHVHNAVWSMFNNAEKDIDKITVPKETEDNYFVTKEDWKYLCDNGVRLFNSSSIRVPSGLTIKYTYKEDVEAKEKFNKDIQRMKNNAKRNNIKVTINRPRGLAPSIKTPIKPIKIIE